MQCPACGFDYLVKNGNKKMRNGEIKQTYLCNECAHSTVNPILDKDKELIEYTVKMAKSRQNFQDTNRIERKAFREYARVENAIVEYNKALIERLEKSNFSQYSKPHKHKPQRVTPIIQISDTHFNDLVNMKHNKYDFTIASRRFKKFFKQIILHLSPFKITNIVLAFTGDLMNSDRRLDELLNQATNRSNATFMAVDILKGFVLDLNQHYNIDAVSVSGNESRMSKEMGYSDIIATDNYDFTIFNILACIFKGSNGIDFRKGDPIEQVIKVQGQNILLLHGSDLPHNPCEAVHKLKGRYASRGVIISYVIFGHLHEALLADLYGRSSSMVGANAYSDKKLNLISRASQNIHIVSNDSINSIKIDLQNTSKDGYPIENINDAYNAKSESKANPKRTIIEITI